MQPANPMTRPWPEIVARYADDALPDSSVEGTAALARHIRDSILSKGLFGWVSMYDLCITQTVVYYPYDGPFLRVKPLFDGQIEFRYIDTPNKSQQWHRTVPASEAISRLESFLSQLHWFYGVLKRDDA